MNDVTVTIQDALDRPIAFTADELADAYCCTAFGYEADAVRKAFAIIAAADALADAVEVWRGEQRHSVQVALTAYYAARRRPSESAQAGDA